jgi:hypothetical protein
MNSALAEIGSPLGTAGALPSGIIFPVLISS